MWPVEHCPAPVLAQQLVPGDAWLMPKCEQQGARNGRACRIEFAGALIRSDSLLDAPLPEKAEAAGDVMLGLQRVERKRAVDIAEAALEHAVIDQEMAVEILRQRDVRRALGSQLEQARRLLPTIRGTEIHAELEDRLVIPAVERGRSLQILDRLFELTVHHVSEASGPVGLGITGIERDRLVERIERLLAAVLGEQREAKAVLRKRHRRQQLESLL